MLTGSGVASSEQEAEARVIPEMLDGVQDGVYVMNDAEVAGVVERDEQRSFDSTCRKFHRFLVQPQR